ncbi:MAG: hypothetical protein ACE5H4_03920 [Candidatus Thorarchaeota archaeon]
MEEVTITELQERMASGELSARKIVETYLGRINELDRGDQNSMPS